jgi:RNA polymerase sigma factor (sigma-70 family)
VEPTAHQSDESTAVLFSRARRGDREAWDAVIGPCLRPLSEFAARWLPADVRSRIGPDDLVQEAVINAIAQLHRFEFRHRGAFLAYLRTSIRHRIVDELRRASRRRAAAPFIEPVDGARSPLQRIIDMQNVERYSRALARLGDRDRQLIVLRVEQQLSYSDVAARLGLSSEPAVRIAVKRALSRLARRLRQCDAMRTVGRNRTQLAAASFDDA